MPGYRRRDAYKQLEQYVYILYEGECALTKKIIRMNAFQRKVQTEEVLLKVFKGEILGEEPLMHRFPSFTVRVSSEHCKFIRIRYADLKNKYPLLVPAILRISEQRQE